MEILRWMAEHWHYLAIGAGAALLLGLYVSAYFAALRPRPGTLEWIARYDRPAFSMAGRWHPLEWRDLRFLLPVCLLALLVWGFAALQALRSAYRGMPPASELLLVSVCYGAMPLASAAAAYCLCKGLFGCAPAAFFGTAALLLDVMTDVEVLLYALLLVLFLTRFATAGAEASFFSAGLPLAAGAAMSAVACYFQPQLALLAAGGLLLLLAACAGRFMELGRGWLWQSLLLYIGVFLAVTWLLYLPAALVQGMGFPRALVSGDYYRMIAARLAENYRGLFYFDAPWVLALLYYDWPMVLLGLAATVAAAVSLCRSRDFRAVLLVLVFTVLTVLWLLSGTYLLPAGCMLSLVCLWTDLYRRRACVLFALGPAVLLAMLGALYLWGYVL